MDASSIININVIIADRPYPLKVKANEEEKVRTAARKVNEKIKLFQNSYEAKDKQDYLAMCALHYSVENLGSQQESSESNTELSEKINSINRDLTDILT